jgi:hypothetical protein
MAVVNIARRLPTKILTADIDSLNGLAIVERYLPIRSEATPEGLQALYSAMLAKQQKETEMEVTLKAAVDSARHAEWEFHNAVLAMKESIRGQFGSDSDAAQAVGYKKKSAYKRPRRQHMS